MTEITIKSPKTGTADSEGKVTPREVTVEYDFGADLNEATQFFGEPVVFTKFVSQGATDLGNSMRAILNDPKNSVQDCIDFAAKWKPGVVTRSPKAKSVDALIAEYEAPDTTEERKLAIIVTLKAVAEEAKKNQAKAQAALKTF